MPKSHYGTWLREPVPADVPHLKRYELACYGCGDLRFAHGTPTQRGATQLQQPRCPRCGGHLLIHSADYNYYGARS